MGQDNMGHAERITKERTQFTNQGTTVERINHRHKEATGQVRYSRDIRQSTDCTEEIDTNVTGRS